MTCNPPDAAALAADINARLTRNLLHHVETPNSIVRDCSCGWRHGQGDLRPVDSHPLWAKHWTAEFHAMEGEEVHA